MKISYSNVHAEFRQAIEDEAKHRLEKLGRLLKHYEPDLVQLHESLEKQPHKAGYIFSLNLSLPTGTLHATGEAVDVRVAAKIAFAEIEIQVKKHQQKLRKDYVWKRKRSRRAIAPDEAATAS
jgi:ribosomal subunit interface protein